LAAALSIEGERIKASRVERDTEAIAV